MFFTKDKADDTIVDGEEQPVKQRTPLPETTSSFFSRIFLVWVFPLVYRGWKTPLEDADLWELAEHERGKHTTTQILSEWERLYALEDEKKRSLGRAIILQHRGALAVTGILKAIDITLLLLQPVFVNRLIVFLEDKEQPPVGVGIGWSFALLVTPFLKTIVENQYFLRTMRGGMRIRSGLQGVIYDKSLRMSPSARASSSLGEIVNLMQLDTQRIGDFYQFSHVLWGAPVQIIVSVILLYVFIGPSAFIGLGLTLVTLPLQGWLMTVQIKLRKAGIGITDRRVKLMNEILQGIKGVKFYAWELPFSRAVEKERGAEVQKISSTVWIRSAFMGIMMVIPVVIGVITFSFFAGVFGQPLLPSRIFTGITLLNQLRAPVMLLPMTITTLIDARLGVKRIQRFLSLENADNYSRDADKSPATDKPAGDESEDIKSSSSSSDNGPSGAIEITNGEFEWSQIANKEEEPEKSGLIQKCLPKRKKKQAETKEDEKMEPSNLARYVSVRGSVLKDINVRFRPGQLTAVVGRVGAGKSSLIHAILGEMRKVQGEVALEGSVAYVAQTAWIFNDSLRNNITFGKSFDEKLYRKAIKVSALSHDISILPAGDLTAIGEKGINLSGGQKQRVSIARAVYADADVYLFDDPLSALDAHVSNEVFRLCLSKRGVLRNKLRLLITNQVHMLPECDNIVFLEAGSIRVQGKYADLAAEDESFKRLINEKQKESENETAEAAEAAEAAAAASVSRDGHSRHSNSIAQNSIPRNGLESLTAGSTTRGLTEKDGKVGQNLIQSEERKTGNVVIRNYYQYAMACGGIVMFTFLILFWCATVALSVVTQWWLAFWAESQAELGTADRPLGFYLGIYFALAIGYAVATVARSVWYLNLALYASKKMHNKMLQSILRAPVSFFDTTPIGRIISRFSRDVNVLDEILPQYFQQMLTTVLNIIASYVFIGVIMPLFISVAIPVLIVYFLLQRFFNRTSLELKRLDSISKSPIYANFSETLGGLSTLRAYGRQDMARENNMNMIDINQRAYFAYIAANRWFALNLEMVGSILVFATAIFGVAQRNAQFASGNVGLSLTYALQVTSFLGFSVRSITELEGQMNSIERVNYYCHDLPQEAAANVEPGPPDEWPSKGTMEIKNVQMRYREELELVLKGVNVSIAGGEKVGVVGRTGSGKSSLMIAILRLVEVAEGEVTVDGIDLSTVGLDDVRKRITIIPQDPVMFSGTIRFNLDPFEEHSEAELWDALEKSHLKEFVEEFDGGLDAKVSEYGENMSAGQRQVICLTRALLRNSKILILDEASSSLDNETDRMIQETIRKYLKDATMLTIAHRLFTLSDYDKILVMDDGVATEFGSPAELMGKEDGAFCSLVKSMGAAGEAQFRQQVAANSSRSD